MLRNPWQYIEEKLINSKRIWEIIKKYNEKIDEYILKEIFLYLNSLQQ
jgi:hypothetical protein